MAGSAEPGIGPPDRRGRALGLLRTMLDLEQREDLLELGGFRVRTPDHIYWIAPGAPPARAEVSSRRIEELCVGPDRLDGMPPEDVAITLLSWIRSDPAGASSTANVVVTHMVPADAGGDELVGRMAALGTPRRRTRVRALDPPPRPGPVLSEAQRRDILAELERIRARVGLRTPARA